MPASQAYNWTNETGIYAHSVSWCFASSTSQKSEYNKFSEAFACIGDKY